MSTVVGAQAERRIRDLLTFCEHVTTAIKSGSREPHLTQPHRKAASYRYHLQEVQQALPEGPLQDWVTLGVIICEQTLSKNLRDHLVDICRTNDKIAKAFTGTFSSEVNAATQTATPGNIVRKDTSQKLKPAERQILAGKALSDIITDGPVS